MLCVEDVSHTFPDGPNRLTALSRIDLSVGAGEFVAVMGPSGSGKTTLVNVAAGIMVPEAGRVLVDGVEVGRVSARRRAQLRRQRIGVVHQSDELDPVLTAVENVGSRSCLMASVDARHAKRLSMHLPSVLPRGWPNDNPISSRAASVEGSRWLGRSLVGGRSRMARLHRRIEEGFCWLTSRRRRSTRPPREHWSSFLSFCPRLVPRC